MEKQKFKYTNKYSNNNTVPQQYLFDISIKRKHTWNETDEGTYLGVQAV